MLFDEIIHLNKSLEKKKFCSDLYHIEEFMLLTNISYIKLYIFLRVKDEMTLNPMIIPNNFFEDPLMIR